VTERRRLTTAFDLALAGVVAAVQLAIALGRWHGHGSHPRSLDWFGVVLVLASGAALAVRRRYPSAVLGVTLAAALTYTAAGYGDGPLYPALVVALLTALAEGRRRAGIASLVVGWSGSLWLEPALGRGHWPGVAGTLGLAAWLLVLFAAGEALRARRERAEELARVRAAELRRQVSEQRLAIARELHDVLAHNISLINIQAGAALHRAQRSEDRAYEALDVIKQVSHGTLAELRSLLHALREVDEAAPRAPAPSLAHIGDLVNSAAAAGVAARVETRGTPRPLPASVELAAYRIVQEALTNVVRHAGSAAADVRLEYGDSCVVVQVDDTGNATCAVAPGTGLTGMRERVAALGGRLEAGPRPTGGFRVRAQIPIQEPT
jgi:signal transduction histidine kinase